jgi:hypothetical protein
LRLRDIDRAPAIAADGCGDRASNNNAGRMDHHAPFPLERSAIGSIRSPRCRFHCRHVGTRKQYCVAAVVDATEVILPEDAILVGGANKACVLLRPRAGAARPLRQVIARGVIRSISATMGQDQRGGHAGREPPKQLYNAEWHYDKRVMNICGCKCFLPRALMLPGSTPTFCPSCRLHEWQVPSSFFFHPAVT